LAKVRVEAATLQLLTTVTPTVRLAVLVPASEPCRGMTAKPSTIGRPSAARLKTTSMRVDLSSRQSGANMVGMTFILATFG